MYRFTYEEENERFASSLAVVYTYPPMKEFGGEKLLSRQKHFCRWNT